MPHEKITKEIQMPHGEDFTTIQVDWFNERNATPYPEHQGVWVSMGLATVETWPVMFLSRNEINRLIHALRRARDAAYGKDA